MPEISKTEQEALDSGNTWLESSIFQGKPDFDGLMSYPDNQLTDEEIDFINGPVAQLLEMIDDYQLTSNTHVPDEIMSFLKGKKFFSFIIPKKHGGLEFSHYANSTIVAKIAAKSGLIATLVIVPNSLGCGELIAHYGTKYQKDYYLPRLSIGEEIPCFALTSPEAGSDAGSIPDIAIVEKRIIDGEEILGFSCSWDKRYITLAPISTLLGLAVKVQDPDRLLNRDVDIGITCLLVPTNIRGVHIGNRHNPMGIGFYNGTTRGTNVFVPIENVIGGQEYIGQGWKMLMACLGAGRGVSIPAQSVGMIQGAFKSTSQYAFVREQFGTEIGNFEGVKEHLALMAGLAFNAEALRKTVLTSLDAGNRPSVLTAITKYHMTEMCRTVLNSAMDIQAGKAVQTGPHNVLNSYYNSVPVCITVEGANILTRNLMIFGQGATRCHPHVKELIDSIYSEDPRADNEFRTILFKVGLYSIRNAGRSFVNGWLPFTIDTKGADNTTKPIIKRIKRLSSLLATHIDFALLVMGGDLKKKEMLSARLGDAMSYLFIAMSAVRYYNLNQNKEEQEPWFEYGAKWSLKQAEIALDEFSSNFPNRPIASLLSFITGKFWLGRTRLPDSLSNTLAESALQNGIIKSAVTSLVTSKKGDGHSLIEEAYLSKLEVLDLLKKLKKSIREGKISKQHQFHELLNEANRIGEISTDEHKKLSEFNVKRKLAIAVDEFDFDFNAIEINQLISPVPGEATISDIKK